ncbi:tripartite motif-containing protein 16 isoform X1 [Danio rerio]|uniref:Tripartite motif-containing protein 16 isoform X1 n=2 Tax=Danio rerio TaxID=7955 RepID=A0AC58I193_DANRE|nr:tripartite motif-containing protein 16 [Danio rerio]|eukprot:XP_003198035.2 tripartite motif-containing protein 16 [Danio rerio]
MSSKMAESSVSLAHREFSCSVCLDLLKDPVAIPCGHSYCMSCITDCWNQEDQKRVYSCPQCRQTFSPRPALAKNTMLAEVLEKLQKSKLQAAGPAQSPAASGDVECDVCTGAKNRAVKSCLVCLNSYCHTHFQRHQQLNPGNRHKVTEATHKLQEMICPQHKKLLEIFCRTDHCCICYLCLLDQHKHHDTVSAAAERTELQSRLRETQSRFQQRLQERQKELEELREAVESHKRSAQAAVDHTERIFTQLICWIERSRSELTQMIRDGEKTAVSGAEERLERLEQEINDLRRRNAELEQLSHTEDHIHFLQSLQSLSVPPGSTDSSSFISSSQLAFDQLAESVSRLRDKLQQFCTEEMKTISRRVSSISIIPAPEPQTREQFLQYSQQFTLDPNTAHTYLVLSEGNTAVENKGSVQPYPDHPDRFDCWRQVLCRESVCGRSYWELEWSGVDVLISVSYKSISRKGSGNECLFGLNDQSWSLCCSADSFSFRHNNINTDLPKPSVSSSRIGVYVDHSAGTLSFYSVSDTTMSLIHTLHTTFTHTLYPGFWVCSRLKLCDLTV